MGGTLWEEPIFVLIYPGTKLQILGARQTNNRCLKKEQTQSGIYRKKFALSIQEGFLWLLDGENGVIP
jgi:hypothetical protein